LFVNRTEELAALEAWWGRPGASMGQIWGRRRVGKTALVGRFAEGRRTVFHTARGVGLAEELATFATKIPDSVAIDRRLDVAPFVSWEDVIITLAQAARQEPLLLVLDEYPELANGDPAIDTRLRAAWEEIRSQTSLKVLLCGSAVRAMQAIAEQRSPLHGRFDLRLLVHPFRPHESALMLPHLSPADRALAWGICDGVPLYLSWWDQSATVDENLTVSRVNPVRRFAPRVSSSSPPRAPPVAWRSRSWAPSPWARVDTPRSSTRSPPIGRSRACWTSWRSCGWSSASSRSRRPTQPDRTHDLPHRGQLPHLLARHPVAVSR
jgi:hypothetical protein